MDTRRKEGRTEGKGVPPAVNSPVSRLELA